MDPVTQVCHLYLVLQCFYELNASPGPESMQFLSELSKNVSMLIYEGNDDLIIAHREAERTYMSIRVGNDTNNPFQWRSKI